MSASRRIPFRCKFDEQMLGFADKLKEDKTVKGSFEEPDDFVDDIVMEKIRGADDETVVEAATEARRMIITNDVDYFFTTTNKYGTLVLRGGIHREDGTLYSFHRLTREDKQYVIRDLFVHYLNEMRRIRDGRLTKLAVLSGNCRVLRIPAQKKPKVILSRVNWDFRDATEDDRVLFMQYKEKQKLDILPDIKIPTFATANSSRSQQVASGTQQVTPPTSPDLQSPNNPHVCDTSIIPCPICTSPITNSVTLAYPSPTD